jgi:hypothetical protein
MITIEQDPIYTLSIKGRKQPGFRLISEWEGLKKLQNTKGEVIILAPCKDRSWVDEMFDHSAFLRGSKSELLEYVPVMVSPSLAEWIKPSTTGDADGCNGVSA